MTIYGLWHGGSSYADGDPRTDMEAFASLAHAARVMREREPDNSGALMLPTFYVHRSAESVRFPAVSGSAMDLYVTSDSPKPYGRLSIGPRGGVRYVSLH